MQISENGLKLIEQFEGLRSRHIKRREETSITRSDMVITVQT